MHMLNLCRWVQQCRTKLHLVWSPTWHNKQSYRMRVLDLCEVNRVSVVTTHLSDLVGSSVESGFSADSGGGSDALFVRGEIGPRLFSSRNDSGGGLHRNDGKGPGGQFTEVLHMYDPPRSNSSPVGRGGGVTSYSWKASDIGSRRDHCVVGFHANGTIEMVLHLSCHSKCPIGLFECLL